MRSVSSLRTAANRQRTESARGGWHSAQVGMRGCAAQCQPPRHADRRVEVKCAGILRSRTATADQRVAVFGCGGGGGGRWAHGVPADGLGAWQLVQQLVPSEPVPRRPIVQRGEHPAEHGRDPEAEPAHLRRGLVQVDALREDLRVGVGAAAPVGPHAVGRVALRRRSIDRSPPDADGNPAPSSAVPYPLCSQYPPRPPAALGWVDGVRG